MKRLLIIIVCILAGILFLSCASAGVDPGGNPVSGTENDFQDHTGGTSGNAFDTFKLPASLERIEEGAFEGTAITAVELPESVKVVENYAFANIRTLSHFKVSENIAYISRTVFDGSANVVLFGAAKGYARDWAQKNNIPFMPIVNCYAHITTTQISGLSAAGANQQRIVAYSESDEGKNQRSSARMTGELKADRYKNISSFHIQGRSPPSES